MSPAASFHAQLASIMEVLANAAVAEICELVDGSHALLQLEIRRCRKENEALRRRLRVTELRAAARAQLVAANGPRRHVTRTETATNTTNMSTPSRSSNQETPRCRDLSPSSEGGQKTTTQQTAAAGETTAMVTAPTMIKEEEDPESWSRSESDGFHRVSEEQEPEASLVKQEAADDGGVSTQPWVSGGASSASVHDTLSAGQRSEVSGGYDCPTFELQLHHGSHTTQNALGVDGGGGGGSASNSGGSFSFTLSDVSFHSNQQRAPPPPPPPAGELRGRKELTGRQSAFLRRGGWRRQDGGGDDDGGGKSFVCNCCGKTLACLKNLKIHMRVHTGEKPFVCALCGKRFSDSSNFKRHQSVHTGEKRYGCVHCGKRFAQSGSLKVHMSVHTDCKQFRCSSCGKTFISGSHLRRHLAVHAADRRAAAAAVVQ